MTREDIFKIAQDGGLVHSSHAHRIADRILAALEKEREGEVVLGRGCANNICSMCGNPFRSSIYHGKCETIRGKVGQLIFRPTKAEKGGK